MIRQLGHLQRHKNSNDLSQYMDEWNETWPQHRELHAPLFTNSACFLFPLGGVNREGLWDGTYRL